MPETATFINHFDETPEDGQVVWFLQAGKRIPVPAEYIAKSGLYSLVRGRLLYPASGDAWAPLIPPENADQCSPPPGGGKKG